MKKCIPINTLTLIGINLLAGFLAFSTVGCDLSDTGDSARTSLEINPRTTNVMFESSALFTVVTDTNKNVALPLVWSVDDTRLGSIAASAGNSAIYVSRSREGVNTVTVRDQGDKEGIARVVIQAPEQTGLPVPTLAADAAALESEEAVAAGTSPVTVINVLPNGTTNTTTRGTVTP